MLMVGTDSFYDSCLETVRTVCLSDGRGLAGLARQICAFVPNLISEVMLFILPQLQVVSRVFCLLSCFVKFEVSWSIYIYILIYIKSFHASYRFLLFLNDSFPQHYKMSLKIYHFICFNLYHRLEYLNLLRIFWAPFRNTEV